MSKGVKIVTIGGGSSYTPELVEGFIKRYEELPIREMWLVDIEEGKEKLEIVGAMAQRMWDATPYDVKVHLTLNRREALKDADFVTTQFRVGLLDARIKDERIPLSHGVIGQETNGAGGMFKAFRTVPIILDIVEDMKELCPDAWIANFTNPSGMVTEAVIKYGKWDKIIGLCNVPIMCRKIAAGVMGKDEEKMNFLFAGLNHFHWHRAWDENGKEITAEVIENLYTDDEAMVKALTNANPQLASRKKDAGVANIKNISFLPEQIRDLGILPCMYHRYYYITDDMLQEEIHEFNANGTRGQVVKAVEEKLFELYKDPNLNYKPEELSKRGGAYYSDAACELVSSIYNDKRIDMVVSTVNNGAIPDLPSDVVVEVSAIIAKNGATPLAWGPFKPGPRGLLQIMKDMELLTVEAAVKGDYDIALQAFTLNPLVPSGKIAKTILNEMLVAHKKHLPLFADSIAKIEAGEL